MKDILLIAVAILADIIFTYSICWYFRGHKGNNKIIL